MASAPDPAPITPNGPLRPIVERAAKLHSEMEDLQSKLARIMRESQLLLKQLREADPPE